MSVLAKTAQDYITGILEQLKTDGKLGTVITQALKKNPLDDPDIHLYPAAVVHPPSMESREEDTITNTRTYTYAITVIMKGEDVANDWDVIQLQEDICNAFDDAYTLGGSAVAGSEPAYSSPEPLNYNGGQYILFAVTLKAKICYTLSSS